MCCSPWGCKELDTTERLHFHFSLSCIGEGNGSPLQCSCLGNPKDGGAWWAAIYGVAQSRTQLKQLSSSNSNIAKYGGCFCCCLFGFVRDLVSICRDITLLTKVCLVKAMVFPIVVYGCEFSSVQFNRSVMSDCLQPHGLQHTRPSCPPTPGVYSNSCPLSQ